MMKSWKTTAIGLAILASLTIIGIFEGVEGVAKFGTVVVSVLAGIGFMLSRDNDRSSERAGAK